MDAISFVLGVKSAQLRSSQLKDLVYRGRRLAKAPVDGSEPTQNQEDDDESDGAEDQRDGSAKKAWVLAVYEDAQKKEWLFQRTYVSSYIRLSNLQVAPLQNFNHRCLGIPSQQPSRHVCRIQRRPRLPQHPRESKELSCVPGRRRSSGIAVAS